MSDIFISYAREDRERILPLVHALEKTGWLIFWDRTIPIGKTWQQVIGEEVENCRCMIVVWSNTSIHSDWVYEEANVGKRRKILFPVFIDNVSAPFGFGSIQAGNLVGWDGKRQSAEFERLLAGLSMVLGRTTAQNKFASTGKKFKTSTPEHLGLYKHKTTKWNLRSKPQLSLSKEAVKQMLKKYDFYCAQRAFTEEYCNPKGNGFFNEFKVQSNGLVVIDETTGLIWKQSKSSESMVYHDTQGYIDALNRQKFAGYNKWRLPTLPEAMSLLTNKPIFHGQSQFKFRGYSSDIKKYIDPIFDFKQDRIWTSDKLNPTEVWDVNFGNGYCYCLDINLEGWVIAVCKR